jgi:lambda family phage portal protein
MPARRSLWDRALGALGLTRTSSLRMRASYYTGAGGGRLLGDFVGSAASPDQLIKTDGPTLRRHAEELVANNSTASRVPSLFSENVIGKDGITMQARVQSTRSDAAGDGSPRVPRYNERVNAEIERGWYDWCEAANASADGKRSWCDTETLIVEREPVAGEVLIRLIDGFDNEHGFTTEIIDPAQLDWSLNRRPTEGANEIRSGVEVDRWGRPVRYHILANHPGESGRGGRRYLPIPAEDMIHLFVQKHERQTRGVTWFAPVIVDLRMLGGYREAELVAARVAASKMGFLKSINPDGPAPNLSPEDGEDHVRWDADPGVIEQLPENTEFQSWDPSHPTNAFAEFDKAILRSIATALRVSYMSLSSDLSDTTYGSGRIGLLAERAVYQKLQQRLIEKVHTRVYRRWLRSALLRGAVRLDSFDPARYDAVQWHPRPFPWIDPAADIEAAEKEQKLGINNITRMAAAQGRDLGGLLDERKREREMFRARGIPHPDDLLEAEIQGMTQPAPDQGARPHIQPPAPARGGGLTHDTKISRHSLRRRRDAVGDPAGET